MTDTNEQPPRILVVTPHPDDAESGAGGTIARFAAQGSSIALVVCTNGDKGTSNGEVTPAQLVEIREGEQLKAAEVLGIERVSFLRFPDQGLEDNDDFREKVVREIRIHKPDIVFTMDPNHLYINHRDHRMCGRVTLDAIFPYARDHLAYPQHLAEGLTRSVRSTCGAASSQTCSWTSPTPMRRSSKRSIVTGVRSEIVPATATSAAGVGGRSATRRRGGRWGSSWRSRSSGSRSFASPTRILRPRRNAYGRGPPLTGC